jgi:hypothetical protein
MPVEPLGCLIELALGKRHAAEFIVHLRPSTLVADLAAQSRSARK